MKKILILFCSVAAFASCNDRIKPSGNVISMDRPTGEFSALEIHSGIKATVTMADEPGLTITADDNIIPYIETYTSGETLIVKVRRNTSIKGNATLKAEVRAVTLTGVSGSGGSSLTFPEGIDRDDLKIVLSGGSQWKGDITAGNLEAVLSGGSGMRTSGSAAGFDLDCSGGSEFNWGGDYGFSADDVEADLSGGSNAKMTVGTSFDVNASGGSRFYYKGDPKEKNANASGGSVIEQK